MEGHVNRALEILLGTRVRYLPVQARPELRGLGMAPGKNVKRGATSRLSNA